MARKTLVFCIAVLALAVAAQAQIGSGWTSYAPSSKIQLVGCGTFSSSSGVETFKLTCSSSSGEQRAERRVQDDFTSGQRQFQGQLKITSLGGSGVCVKQTFQTNSGAFLMIAVKSGGTLYDVHSGTTLATGVVGASIRINTVTDVGAKKTTEYVNGSLKCTLSGGSTPFYNKYGTYRLGSGHGPITAQWSSVKYWKK